MHTDSEKHIIVIIGHRVVVTSGRGILFGGGGFHCAWECIIELYGHPLKRMYCDKASENGQ